MKINLKKSDQNLFMPNFTTKNIVNDDDEEESSSDVKSSNFSVISQWDKLPTTDSDPDESFSEMKPIVSNPATISLSPKGTPTRKVIVSQLQSHIEEVKKPETWAKAVLGQKSSPSSVPERPISCDTTTNNSDEKENVEVPIVKNDAVPQITNDLNQKADKRSVNDTIEAIHEEADHVNVTFEKSDEKAPVWILPVEENKPKKRKKNKKKTIKEDK